jgi:hypothetical protein
MSDLTTLLADYVQTDATCTRLENELNEARARRSRIVKTVRETHGRGPYDLDGVPHFVISGKGGATHFFREARKK